MLAGLAYAATRLDVEMIEQYLEQTKTCDADLARVLAELAAEFKYDQILALIQAARGTRS